MRRLVLFFLLVILFLTACGGRSEKSNENDSAIGGGDQDLGLADDRHEEEAKEDAGSGDQEDELAGESFVISDDTGDEIASDVTAFDDDLTDDEIPDDDNDVLILLPPANGQFDYQLGGAYDPPIGVVVVTRDRTEMPAAGRYNICYVNGFQTQPDEADWWLTQHPELILRDKSGHPVIDPDWPDEMLLDITTPQKRAAIATIVGIWIEGCATDGYRAVEIDNLDSYSRSKGQISVEDAVALIRLFADTAHAAGLAIGQKNAVEISFRRAETALDFAVAEECNRYDECGDYTASYGDLVFVIEYDDESFQQGCLDFPQLSIIRRDIMLTMPGDPDYRYDSC